MKLTTVFSAVNENPHYYMFIPKQIKFWGKFNIKFIAVFVGDKLPEELEPYKDNIILWKNSNNLNSAYVGQNLRIYYPALLDLPKNEIVMITDMDMLPTSDKFYTSGLENFNIDDFIYYRHIDYFYKQIYMCYNAAHPKTWSKIFDIKSEEDIRNRLVKNYNNSYNGHPGETGWTIDQEVMYEKLINYPHLKVLNRPIRRLEMDVYRAILINKENFLPYFDDAHFHRNYFTNLPLILDAEKRLFL